MLRSAFSNINIQRIFVRKIHSSPAVKLKEIFVEKKNNQTTIVEAKFIESPRKPYLLNTNKNSSKCPLCQLQLNLKYTDVLILSQYINSKGEIFPQFKTRLCKDQYKLVKELIYMAQYAGLLPKPSSLILDKPYQKLNTYYDESTIVLRPKHKKYEDRFYYLKLSPIEKLRVKPQLGVHIGKKYN